MVLPKCWQLLTIALLCSCIAFSRAYLATPATRSMAFKVRYNLTYSSCPLKLLYYIIRCCCACFPYQSSLFEAPILHVDVTLLPYRLRPELAAPPSEQ